MTGGTGTLTGPIFRTRSVFSGSVLRVPNAGSRGLLVAVCSRKPSRLIPKPSVVSGVSNFGRSAHGVEAVIPSVEITVPSVKTVSYTHLRAHETPEHLVCR